MNHVSYRGRRMKQSELDAMIHFKFVATSFPSTLTMN